MSFRKVYSLSKFPGLEEFSVSNFSTAIELIALDILFNVTVMLRQI